MCVWECSTRLDCEPSAVKEAATLHPCCWHSGTAASSTLAMSQSSALQVSRHSRTRTRLCLELGHKRKSAKPTHAFTNTSACVCVSVTSSRTCQCSLSDSSRALLDDVLPSIEVGGEDGLHGEKDQPRSYKFSSEELTR